MEFLTELATSGGGIGAAVSGISGLLGGWLTKRENRLMTKEQNAHELKLADIDKEMAKFEFDANVKMAEVQKDMALAKAEIELTMAKTEGEIQKDLVDANTRQKIEDAAGKALAEGIKVQNAPTGYPAVDKFRAITRPALTWSLYIFTVLIFLLLHIEVGDLVAEDTDLLVRLYVYIVQAVIYLMIMSTSWWFMSRGDQAAKNIKNMFK